MRFTWEECVSVLLFIVPLLCILPSVRARRKALPPGPPPLGLLGNLHQAPGKSPWVQYRRWHKQYGPIVSLGFGANRVISISSHEYADELLSRRNCVSRPSMPIPERATRGMNVILLQKGEKLQLYRKIMATLLSPSSLHLYRPVEDVESKQLLFDLLAADSFRPHFQRYAVSTIFKLSYGRRLSVDSPESHELSEIMETLNSTMSQALNLLAKMLSGVPEWMCPWNRKADKYFERSCGFFLDNLGRGREMKRTWSSVVYQMECAAALSDIEIASVIGAINEGGSETVGSFLAVFVLASVLYPDAVSEAQKELDSVVGLSRLPCFSDREELPYTRAFIKEIQRWHPLVPLGIPRVADRDERLAGYHIPKGSIILPNHWSMHLDGDTFNQPEEFRPERWLLGENLPLRAFGFGRRICPGMHIAEDILFIAVSRLLWAFNFQTGSGSEPAAAVRPYRMEQTMIAAPLPFDAALTVRSTRHREIICQQWSVERSREIESGWPSPIAADVS